MTRSEMDSETRADRNFRFWVRVAVFFACLSLVGQVFALVVHVCAPAPPTLHSRRITVGGQTITLEIPDGQCASALGVTICVPPRAH